METNPSPQLAAPTVEAVVRQLFVVLSKGAKRGAEAVVAPVGYHRTADGIEKDGAPSPEMGGIGKAYWFSSHRRAAASASKLASPVILEMSKGAK